MRSNNNWKKQFLIWLCLVAMMITPPVSKAAGGTIVPGKFHFTTFAVPGQVGLSLEDINLEGTVVGYYFVGTAVASGPIRSFERFPNGVIQVQDDPLDVEGSGDPYGGITQVGGINIAGVEAGQFFDTSANNYAGYILQNGKFTTYNAPGYTNTAIYAINDLGDFCGLVQNFTPGVVTSAFVKIRGKVSVFTIPGSLFIYASAMNNFGVVVGAYEDSEGAYHGFIRDVKGNLTYPINITGASTTPRFGTIPAGLNDFGIISGHFWDASNIEHGFMLLPNGQFLQIDVPGAAQTSGGGLNDFGMVTGHYTDKSGNELGYIATPELPLT